MALIARGGTRVEEVKKKKGGDGRSRRPDDPHLVCPEAFMCCARQHERERDREREGFFYSERTINARHSSTVGSDVARIPNSEVVQKISPLFFVLLFQKKYLYISKVFSHSLGIISTS